MHRKLLAAAALAVVALVSFVLIDPAEAASTSMAQIRTMFSPPGTAHKDAALVIDTKNFGTSEKGISVGTGTTSVFSVDKEGDVEVAKRLNTAAHGAGVGLNIPTFAGACTDVTDDAEGDVCWDSTNDALYVHNGANWGTLGTSSWSLTGQSLPTFDPAGTTDAQAAVYFNVAGYEANEKILALSTGGSIDEDSDLSMVTVTGTTSVTAPVGGFILGATAVDADADEIDKLDGLATTEAELATLNLAPLGTHTISCADDAAGTTSLCTVQLVNAAGGDMAVRSAVFIYLSDDANGDSIVATAPSGGWAITTDGLLISQVTNKAATFISESDGDIDFTITEAGALTIYVILVDSSGRLIASSALAFDA